MPKTIRTLILCAMAAARLAPAQPTNPPISTPTLTITLEDALTRAAQYGTQIQSANLALALAQQDTVQVRAARLPSVTAQNGYIGTQANGTPSGVFVANNGPHEYIEQAAVHEELLAFIRRGALQRSLAAEAVARARIDVAARGLKTTVVQNFYAIVSAARVARNAQTSVAEAQRFFDITRQLQQGGEAAQADVIKAQINLQTRQRELLEAQSALEKAKIALAVLVFPDLNTDFAAADNLLPFTLLPPIPDARSQAVAANPDLRAATAGVQEAGLGIKVARYDYLPSMGLDFFYGIDANNFAYRSLQEGERVRNLGYSVKATLDIPIWNWGSIRSKVRQAELRRDQAQLELTLAQRTLQGNFATLYAEAQIALAQLDSLRSSNDLSAESLRLTQLRYQAGEANALEVVDAQSTAAQARNAYDQGLARYRVAFDSLRLLMGTL